MNVHLTPKLETMIRQKVADGSYNNASEVVREALRLMEVRDSLDAAKLEQLRLDIHEGLNSPSLGELDGDAVKQRGRLRLAALGQ